MRFYGLVAVFLIGFAGNFLFAQEVDFQWVKSTIATAIPEVGPSIEKGHSITTDLEGNVLITGEFRGTVDFDPGPNVFNLISIGRSDVFMQKLDAFGNFLWAKSLGGYAWETGHSVTTDSFGNSYFTGYYNGPAFFDSAGVSVTLNSPSQGFGTFIQKLDPNGNLLWTKKISGNNTYDSCEGFSITTDEVNNVYVSGKYEGQVDFDPGVGVYQMIADNSLNGFEDVFLLKLNENGGFVWVKDLNVATGNWSDRQLAADNQGGIFLTGSFQQSQDFDPNQGVYMLNSGLAGSALFIEKLDLDGNLLWAKSLGGSDGFSTFEEGFEVGTDSLGNVYFNGRFGGTEDFDPGIGTYSMSANGVSSLFVEKLDADGNFIWAEPYSPSSAPNNYALGFFVDPGGYAYLKGSHYTQILNLDSTYYIHKLDPTGSLIWSEAILSYDFDATGNVSVDVANNIFITGGFFGTVDFNPGPGIFELTSSFISSAYILKLSQKDFTQSGFNEKSLHEVKLYPNPSSGMVHIDVGEVGNIQLDLYNSHGKLIKTVEDIQASGYALFLPEESAMYYLKIHKNGTFRTVKIVNQ